MKRILFFLFVALTAQSINAQSVGIGTATPNASAQLDITSTTKGLLIPRMTGAQRAAIPAAAVGMMVIQTNTETTPPSSPGLYLREQVGASLVWRRIARTDEITSGTSTWTVNGIDQYSNVVGNVGIGTSANINEKFTLKGNALFVYPDGSNSVTLNLMGNSNNSSRIHFIRPDSSILGSIYGWDLTDNLYLQAASNSSQLVLDQNGFVGIKTATPTKALDVFGSIRSRDTITADDDIVAGDNIIAGDNITAGGTITASSTITGATLSSTGVLTVAGNSLFGGTAVVNGELSTNTGVTINDAAGFLNFKTGGISKGFAQLNGDDLRIGCNSSNVNGKFVVRTAAGDQFFVDNAGYVGIGVATNGAEARVHVGTGLDAGLNSNGYLMLGNSATSNLVFDNNEIMARGGAGTVGNLVLQNDGGTVRIGSVAVPAGYKFAINGKMICEELKIKLASAGWPDYVFANDYKLQPLTEVEKFIQKNKHLPNIPSAKEVEKNGIAVGDMQKRMMEKIEELTLYIIQLQKQIDELKNK